MGGAADAGQGGLDVLVVVEGAGDPGADLREHLVVDAGRALIDDQQGDVVLAQLAGDGAEDRLVGGARVEELVGLFDGDHQLGRGLALALLVRLDLLGPLAVDAAGDDVGGQHVGEQVALLAELQDDVLAVAEGGDQLVEAGVAVGDSRLDERQALDPQEPALEGGERLGMRADADGDLFGIGVLVGELRDPVPAEALLAEAGRVDGGGVQLELVGEQRDVLDGDLVEADADDAVVARCRSRGSRV